MPSKLHLLASRSVRALALPALLLATFAGPVLAANYPPQIPPPDPDAVKWTGEIQPNGGPIFSNTHNYGAVIIRVDVFNNYFGDFNKYHWVYTVTNVSYEPNPGLTNGFSGFELALPLAVPDIGDITAPDGIGPWLINCCSGLPVEWDLTNSGGAGVGGGTLPGQTEVYSFTTLPRLITVSSGWFHSWQGDVQVAIVNYPTGDAPEVPDVLSEPNQELCCTQNPDGTYTCQTLPVGQCEAIGGIIVPSCTQCPPVTPAQRKSWGSVKGGYR